MTSLLTHIAVQLKTLRTEKGWSLDQTAKETGISKAMLGQIEREESNPTVQTLWKIALGFHTSLSAFLPAEQQSETVLKHQDEALSVKILQPFNPVLGYEILHITLKANAAHHSCAHEKGVIEDILPLNGQINIRIGDENFTALPSQVIRVAADQEHIYINSSHENIEFYNIIHYPTVH